MVLFFFLNFPPNSWNPAPSPHRQLSSFSCLPALKCRCWVILLSSHTAALPRKSHHLPWFSLPALCGWLSALLAQLSFQFSHPGDVYSSRWRLLIQATSTHSGDLCASVCMSLSTSDPGSVCLRFPTYLSPAFSIQLNGASTYPAHILGDLCSFFSCTLRFQKATDTVQVFISNVSQMFLKGDPFFFSPTPLDTHILSLGTCNLQLYYPQVPF